MLAYIIRRLLLMIPTLLGIMVVNFAIVQVAPVGDRVLAVAVADDPGVWATGDRLHCASIGDGLRAFESARKSASL